MARRSPYSSSQVAGLRYRNGEAPLLAAHSNVFGLTANPPLSGGVYAHSSTGLTSRLRREQRRLAFASRARNACKLQAIVSCVALH
jgi:hypothetical protein